MSDLLLEWMSFRGAGRTNDLPAGILDHESPHRVVDNLATLGHVEIVSRAKWRITPPALAALPSDSAQATSAVLCGARTSGVIAALSGACARTGAHMAVEAFRGRPSVVRVTSASGSVLAAVAFESGIPLQHDAAFTLLACLPTVREWPRIPCRMVAGRVPMVRRFSRSKLGWVESSLREAAAKGGLFRIKRDWDWVTILKSDADDCAYIDDRAGRLAVAAKLRSVRWDEQSRVFSLPIPLIPPIIIARALTLCTGELPKFDMATRRVSFAGVTSKMCGVALAITGLRLE